MHPTHIFLGAIGTITETSQMQYDAFNQAFQNLGVKYQWPRDEYIASLSGSGGKNRLADIRLSDGSQLSDEQIAALHSEKTKIFDRMMIEDGIKLRNGVEGLIASSRQDKIKLIWATTTVQENIDAIFSAAGDQLQQSDFAKITNRSYVDSNKPAPEIYEKLMGELGLDASAILVIEDSVTGIAAAKSAGLTAIAFPGEFTKDQDFSAADRTIASLSEI